MGVEIEFQNISKRFGKTQALDDLSFRFEKNSTTAFVGANGAGKTTTFSILGHFLKPDTGEVLLDGKKLIEFRKNGGMTGLLPQDVMFFEDRSVIRQMILFSRLSGMSTKEANREAERTLEMVGLTDKKREKVEHLSRGMKVRLGVAQALIGTPPLIVLDEPTSGLDPQRVKEFREIMAQIKGSTTIVISSHVLNELEGLCDRVCILDKGVLMKEGHLKALRKDTSRVSFTLESWSGDLHPLQELLPDFILSLEQDKLTASFDSNQFSLGAVNQIVIRELMALNIAILSIESEKSLEQVYFDSIAKP